MTNFNFTPQKFIDSGYKHFPFRDKELYKNADLFFQKQIKDNDKTKYFINAYYYNLFEQNCVTFEVVFYLHTGQNLHTSISNRDFATISEVETLFEHLYKTNNFTYDLDNN